MEKRIWTRDFLFLCLANLFMFASFFLLMSSLPLFVVNDLHGKESDVGLIIGLFTVSAVLIRPYAGMFLDRLGRRKMMLASLVLFAFATAGYFLVSSVFLLLLLRLFHGAAFGLATTSAGTVATDIVPPERRGEGLGYYGTFNMLAMVVGPALGLMIIQKYSANMLFIMSTSVAIIALVLAYIIRYREIDSSPQMKMRFSDWIKMIEPKAIPYSIPVIGTGVVYGGLVSFISLYAVEIGEASWAGSFFISFAITLVVSRAWAGKIFDRKGANLVIYPSLILFIIGLLLVSTAESQLVFNLAAACIGFGYGSTQPCLQALSIQGISDERRGAATATFYIFVDAGIGLGSFILGGLAGMIGYRSMYLFTIVFIVFSMISYFWAKKRETKNKMIRNSLLGFDESF